MKLGRIYFQEKLVNMLEEAENNLSNEQFELLLDRLSDILKDYK